jgi:hypothetical protein
VGNELCEVDDDPCCLYIRAKTLLGIPGRGTENEAAIKQVLESQKLTCELGIAAARLLTVGGRKKMLMASFHTLTMRFADPLDLERVYIAWLNDLAYVLNDLGLASEVMALAVQNRIPSPHSTHFFATICENIATTLVDDDKSKEALCWLQWLSELFRDDFAKLALVKSRSTHARVASVYPSSCRSGTVALASPRSESCIRAGLVCSCKSAIQD